MKAEQFFAQDGGLLWRALVLGHEHAKHFFLCLWECRARRGRDKRIQIEWDGHQFANARRSPCPIYEGFALITAQRSCQFALLIVGQGVRISTIAPAIGSACRRVPITTLKTG